MDPKLQATYDRVMDTPTQPAQGMQPTGLQTSPGLNTTPRAASVPPSPAYTADNLSFQAAIQQNPVVGSPLAAAPVQIQQKKSSSLLKILYIIGALVFFAVYTFFWLKIFNISLPF